MLEVEGRTLQTNPPKPDFSRRWTALAGHRHFLHAQAVRLLEFFSGAVNPAGGFFSLDTAGAPMPGPPLRQLHSTTRMVHCYSIATLMGRPGAANIVDHGLDYIWRGHRDARHGGYHWSIGPDGPADATKQAYGHAFVLLAASSAKVAGHPDADRLLADVTDVLHTRFWDEAAGATRIKRLRDALGNQLVSELLVKTIARRGYVLAVGKDVIRMI